MSIVISQVHHAVYDGCRIGVFAEKRENDGVLAVWGLVIVGGEQSKKWSDLGCKV